MKLVKTKVKENKADILKAYISEIEHYVTFAYLFCMLGIFPLYYNTIIVICQVFIAMGGYIF